MFCGIWGGIATGLFCHPDNYKDLYSEDDEHNGYGLFYDVSLLNNSSQSVSGSASIKSHASGKSV